MEQKLEPPYDQIGIMTTTNVPWLVTLLEYFVVVKWECLTLSVQETLFAPQFKNLIERLCHSWDSIYHMISQSAP